MVAVVGEEDDGGAGAQGGYQDRVEFTVLIESWVS